MTRPSARLTLLIAVLCTAVGLHRGWSQSSLSLVKGTTYSYSGQVPQINGVVPNVSAWTWTFTIKPSGSVTADNVTTDAYITHTANNSTDPTHGNYTFTVLGSEDTALPAAGGPCKMTIYAVGTGFTGTLVKTTLQVSLPTSTGTVDLSGVLSAQAANTALDQQEITLLNGVTTAQGVTNTGIAQTNTSQTSQSNAIAALQASINALTTATALPGAPTSPIASAPVAGNSLLLSWTPAASASTDGLTGYKVSWGTASTPPYTSNAIAPVGTSYTILGLTAGTPIFAIVQAQGTNGLSAATSPVSATPVSPPVLNSGAFPTGTPPSVSATLGAVTTVAAANYDYGTVDSGTTAVAALTSGVVANFPSQGGGTSTYRTDLGVKNLKANTDTNATAFPWAIGNVANNTYASYTVNVAATHAFDISFRVANGQASTTTAAGFDLYDGTTLLTPNPDVAVPGTGGGFVASDWQTVSAGSYTLSAGSHTLVFYVDSQFLDVNEMILTSVAPAAVITLNSIATPAIGATTTSATLASGSAVPLAGNWYKVSNATVQVTAASGTSVTLFNGGAASNAGITTLVGAMTATTAPTSGQYAVTGTTGNHELHAYGLAIPPLDSLISGVYTTGATVNGVTWTFNTPEPASVSSNPSQPTNANPQVWVAVRADSTAGTGTQTDPFDGSTADKLAGIMSGTHASNTTFHFAKGTFPIWRGGSVTGHNVPTTRPGNMVLGAGTDQTIFSAQDNATNYGSGNYNNAVWYSGSSGGDSGFNLWDCTTDCNSATMPVKASDGKGGYNGAYSSVGGNNIRFERCKVIDFGSARPATVTTSTDTGGENFTANTFANSNTGTITNYVFDRVIFSNMTANLTDGNTTMPWDGSNWDQTTCWISNCRFMDLQDSNSGHYTHCFGLHPQGFGNYSHGVQVGVYNELSGAASSNGQWNHDNYYDQCLQGYNMPFTRGGAAAGHSPGSLPGVQRFEYNTVIILPGGGAAGQNINPDGLLMDAANPQVTEVDLIGNTFNTGPHQGIICNNSSDLPGSPAVQNYVHMGAFKVMNNKIISTGTPIAVTGTQYINLTWSGNVNGSGTTIASP